jgi:hypothetical protein
LVVVVAAVAVAVVMIPMLKGTKNSHFTLLF